MVCAWSKLWRILCNAYVSFYPDSLEKVFITGGLPPLDAHPDDIYRATFKRVIEKNNLFLKYFLKRKRL